MTDIASPVPAPAPGATPPPISRATYDMPMFATMLVGDVERTTSWYVDGLGFIALFTIPGPSVPPTTLAVPRPARPSRLRAGHLWQREPAQLRRSVRRAREPGSKGRAHGGGRVDGPSDTAWNTRDLTTIDPDGNVVRFTAARPPDRFDPALTNR